MKLTFHGENLAEIHKQILDAADTITRVDVKFEEKKSNTPLTDKLILKSAIDLVTDKPVAASQTEKPVHRLAFEQFKEGIAEALKPVEPVLTSIPKAPVFNQAVAQAEEATEPTHIDGNRISNGSVWVPVEGRSNAFTGIPMDRYLAQKAAKESGGDLDSKGTPWDANIHTSTKLKTQSGEWKKRAVRGSKVDVANQAIEAVKPVFQAPAPPMAQQAVHIPNTTPTWQPATSQPSQPGPAPVVDIPQYEQSSAPIGMAPAGHTYASFKANLNMIMVKLINERKIERDYVKELADYFQVQNIWDVVNDDAKCNELFKSFIENGFITGM